MKTLEQVKNDLWKRFREEVNSQISLKDEDLLRLMTDGVIFVRVFVLSDGTPTAKVVSKEQIAKDPR